MNFRSFLKALILPTLVGCAIILSAISTASAANAVGSPGQRSDHEECRSLPEDDDFSAERAFDACDRIIKRGDATGDYLAQTYNSRAVELERRGEWKLAEEDYREAISINANYAIAWNNLSELLYKNGRYREAMDAATSAIAANESDDWGYQNRAHALRALGRYPEAREDLEMALTLAPEAAWTHQESGYLYSDNGEYEKGLEAFRRAYELTPEDPSRQYGVAYGLDDVRRFREALDWLNTHIAKNRTTDLVNLRGLIYTNRSDDVRDLKRGISDLEWVVGQDAEYAMAFYNLSRAYARDDRPRDAIRLLQQGLSIEVRQGQAQDIIRILRKNGEQASAERAAKLLSDAAK